MLPPFLSAHLIEFGVLLLQLSRAKGICPACALYNNIIIIIITIIIITTTTTIIIIIINSLSSSMS